MLIQNSISLDSFGDVSCLRGKDRLKSSDYFIFDSWMAKLPTTSIDRLVFAVLFSHSHDGERLSTCSRARIAAFTCVTPETVSASLRRLESLGLIAVESGSSPRLKVRIGDVSSFIKDGPRLRISSWMVTEADIASPSDLLTWAYIYAKTKKGKKILQTTRNSIASDLGVSPSTIARSLKALDADYGLIRRCSVNVGGGGRRIRLVPAVRHLEPGEQETPREEPSSNQSKDQTHANVVPENDLRNVTDLESNGQISGFDTEPEGNSKLTESTNQPNCWPNGRSAGGDDVEAGFAGLVALAANKNGTRDAESDSYHAALTAYSKVLDLGFLPDDVSGALIDYQGQLEAEGKLRFARRLENWLQDLSPLGATSLAAKRRTIREQADKIEAEQERAEAEQAAEEALASDPGLRLLRAELEAVGKEFFAFARSRGMDPAKMKEDDKAEYARLEAAGKEKKAELVAYEASLRERALTAKIN